MKRKLEIAQILVLIHQVWETVGPVGEDKLKLFFRCYRNKNISFNLSNRYTYKPPFNSFRRNYQFVSTSIKQQIILSSVICCKRPTNLILGERWISLQFGNRHFELSFQLALVGADFIKAFNLLLDVVGPQILDLSSFQVISVSPLANQSPFYTAFINTPTQYRAILAEFPGITADRSTPKSKPAHIQTTGLPVYAKVCWLDQTRSKGRIRQHGSSTLFYF